MRMSLLAAALVAGFSLPAGAADITQSGFSPLYIGVDLETATIPTNPTASGTPTTSRAYIARIDLRAPGISFNANFFAPCCDAFAEAKTVIGLLVSRGKVVAPASTDPLNSEAVLAISRNNEAVIDGRVTGYSLGTTNAQSAALMLAIGCSSALNLDGGGSTEMVRADVLGKPYIVNNPSGGAERFDAAALGVYAWPLPRFEEPHPFGY